MSKGSSLSREEEALLTKLHLLKFGPVGQKKATPTLGEVLSQALPQLNRRPTPRRESVGSLTPSWNKAVGPYLAAHTQLLRWEGPILVVRVDTAALVESLTQLEPELLIKLRQFGLPQLNRFRFVQGKLLAKPDQPAQLELSPEPVPPEPLPEWVNEVRPELQARVKSLMEKVQQHKSGASNPDAAAQTPSQPESASPRPTGRVPLGTGRSES